MSRSRYVAAGAAVMLLAAVFVSPAAARGPGGDHPGHGRSDDARPEHSKDRGQGRGKARLGVTKMRFKLDQHHFDSGATVTATASLYERSGNQWVRMADAPLTILVDGTVVGQAPTGAEGGDALIEVGGLTDGDHVMKVIFEGSPTHRKSQRAQGFHVGALIEEPEEELEEIEVIEPLPLPDTGLLS